MNTKQILPVVVIVVMACFKNYAQTVKVSEIGSPISMETAQTWIEKFQSTNPDQVSGHTYGKVILAKLLASPGAKGIYFFNGLDEKGTVHLILKAANEKGEPQGPAVNATLVCPPYCPPEENIASLGKIINEGHAQRLISTFEQTVPGRPRAHLYGKDILTSILSMKDVAGIFIAYGLDDKNNEHLVFVGVNSSGKILWESSANASMVCPPYCPEDMKPRASKK